MALIAKLDTAAEGYTVMCDRLEDGERRYLSTATHRVTLEGPAGVTVRSCQVPAETDACALARARNVVDMIGMGLLDPAPTSRKATREASRLWIYLMMVPAGEVAIPALV